MTVPLSIFDPLHVVTSCPIPLVRVVRMTKALNDAKSNETIPSCQSRETLVEQAFRLSNTSAASKPILCIVETLSVDWYVPFDS